MTEENTASVRRALLDGFFRMNGMSAKGDEIVRVLAEMRYDGEEAIRQRLVNELHMLPCKVETLLDFVSDKGDDTLFYLAQLRGILPEYDAALDALEKHCQNVALIDLTKF